MRSSCRVNNAIICVLRLRLCPAELFAGQLIRSTEWLKGRIIRKGDKIFCTKASSGDTVLRPIGGRNCWNSATMPQALKI